MIQTTDDLLDAVLALDVKSRAAFAHRLLRSLDDDDSEAEQTMDPEIGRAWGEEVMRRLQDSREGKTEPQDLYEAIARIEAALDAKKRP